VLFKVFDLKKKKLLNRYTLFIFVVLGYELCAHTALILF
jgi:hypothetical protein